MNQDQDTAHPFVDATKQFTDGQNQFLKMWAEFAGKMGNAGFSFPPDSTPPDTAKEMRNTFFKAWTDYCNRYMQSPEFLESWKKAMDGAIQFRRQMNESLGRMHHEFGGTSRQDIDHMMQAMSHLERRLIANQERSAQQLEEMSGKIKDLEKQLAKAKGKNQDKKKPKKEDTKSN